MYKQKFDPELASEMEWSECVLAASVADEDKTSPVTWWECVGCKMALWIHNHAELTDTAQEYLDAGWRYRRTRTGIDALCPHCTRKNHKR